MDNFEIMRVDKKEEIINAKKILSMHVANAANNNLKFERAYKATYIDDYSFNSLKRSKIIDCICENAKFISTTFTGSIFEETKFINCDLSNVSFDFCLFYRCIFSSDIMEKGIINANLGNTNFVQCKWTTLPINKSVLSNSLFEQNIFDGCTIQYSSFENTVFQSCKFKNMELRDINLEFSEFIDPVFEDVVLPFSQIPYTFGLLNTLTENREKIYVSSSSSQKRLSVMEYFDILPQIIPYYIENQEFFPIANIYIALKDYEKAFQAILSGMRKAGIEKDFRMLKHFCKLSVSSGWCDRAKIKKLYSFIYDLKNFEPMIAYQRHNYYLHLGDFRKILLYNDNMLPTLNVRLQTNILPDKTENIALVIESLNNIIDEIGEENVISSFELHHESPYEIFLFIIGGLVLLKLIAENIHTICEPIKDVQEIILNDQQMKINESIIKENEQKIKNAKKIAKEQKQQLLLHNVKIKANIYMTNCNTQEN